MSRRLAVSLRLLVIAVVAACLWWFVRKLDWEQLGEALRTAPVWPLVIAAMLNFVCLWGKAASWRIMLAPRYVVKLARLLRYTIAAFAASAIAPARAGEVLRLWVLKRRDNVPVSASAAVAIAEKLLDGVTILMIAAPVPWLLPGLPSWVASSILVCASVAGAAFIILNIAVGRLASRETGSHSWFARFIVGMHVLRSPRRLMLALLSLMLVWAADLGEILLVSHAVGIELPVAAAILVLFTLNLAIAVPSTPASVGALEVGAMAAMHILHVPSARAFAFALLYHSLQILPLVVVGLVLELRLVLGRDPTIRAGYAEVETEEAAAVVAPEEETELPAARALEP